METKTTSTNGRRIPQCTTHHVKENKRKKKSKLAEETDNQVPSIEKSGCERRQAKKKNAVSRLRKA